MVDICPPGGVWSSLPLIESKTKDLTTVPVTMNVALAVKNTQQTFRLLVLMAGECSTVVNEDGAAALMMGDKGALERVKSASGSALKKQRLPDRVPCRCLGLVNAVGV